MKELEEKESCIKRLKGGSQSYENLVIEAASSLKEQPANQVD